MAFLARPNANPARARFHQFRGLAADLLPGPARRETEQTFFIELTHPLRDFKLARYPKPGPAQETASRPVLSISLHQSSGHRIAANFGAADSPVLAVLRRVLRDSREAARKEGIAIRVRLDLQKLE